MAEIGSSTEATLSSLKTVLGTDDYAAAHPRARPALISSSSVGAANRGRLLQALFDLGPTSRAELARFTGVNRATISGIIQPLVDERILVEGKPLPSSEGGGKPARPLWFAPDAQPICAVLVQHNRVRACLVSLTGEITAEYTAGFDPDTLSIDAIAATIVGCAAKALDHAHRPPLGIGVSAVGMVDTARQEIVQVNLAPVLKGFAIGRHLFEQFGLTTAVDHHPRTLLVGDKWFGLGRGKSNFAVIYTGEVLGGALFLNGNLYRGQSGAGGELGHTFVQVDGAVCSCGRRGCWETIATLNWLRHEAERRKLPDAQHMNAARLSLLVAAGHGSAVKLLDLYARNIAVGIANLQQTMAPNYFVLHGDVVEGGQRMMDAVFAHVRKLVPSRPGGDIELVMGDSEDVAALRGAAGLVLSQLLQFSI